MPRNPFATDRYLWSMLVSLAMTEHVAITASKFQIATARGLAVLSKRCFAKPRWVTLPPGTEPAPLGCPCRCCSFSKISAHGLEYCSIFATDVPSLSPKSIVVCTSSSIASSLKVR